FDYDALRVCLANRLGVQNIERITMGRDLEIVVLEVVEHYSGTESDAFVEAVHAHNPGAPRLAAFYDAYKRARDAARPLPGVHPFDMRLLAGDRLFLNRGSLRKALRRLASPTGANVLIVNAPVGIVGKSHTKWLIEYFAQY